MMLSVSLFSQSSQYFEYETIGNIVTDYSYESATMVANDGTAFLLVPKPHSGGFIFKLTEDGEIDDSKYIELKDQGQDGDNPFFSHPYDSNVNVYVYIMRTGNIPLYNVLFFDNDLNVIDKISAPLYSNENIIYSGIKYLLRDNENNIVIFIRINEDDNKFLLVKFDIYGNLLNEKEFVFETRRYIQEISSSPLCVYNNDPLQYGFMVITNDKHHNSKELPTPCLAVLDSDFNVVEIKNDLYYCEPSDRADISGFDDYYLVSGDNFKAGYLYEFANVIELHKFDKEHNLLKTYEYSINFLENNFKNPALAFKNIIPTDDGDIYWIYCLVDNGGSRSTLNVSRFDSDLNLKWQHEICEVNNAKRVYIHSPAVCKNGDLVFSGLVWACQGSNHYDFNLFTTVVKNEVQPMDISENTTSVKPFYLHPNPASEMINVSFAQDVNCENVEIYSLDGRLCHSQNFNFNNINIENLSSGIYMMKITLNNGQTYSEKVVVK